MTPAVPSSPPPEQNPNVRGNICQVTAEPPETAKFFSTYLCDCVDDEGKSTDECLGNCWEWQRVDLEESLRGWHAKTETCWFGFSNIIVQRTDGGFHRDSGYVMGNDVCDLVDFMITAGDDFSIYYEVPDPADREWHFWQESPNDREGDELKWVKCKSFHSAVDRM